MTLIRRARRAANLIQKQHELINSQNRLILDQNSALRQQKSELQRLQLEHLRAVHGIVCAWLIHHERPEVDMRPELAEFETDLGHQVAQLEEYIL